MERGEVMGWFTSEYKEDALKWRAQVADREQKEVARKFKMTIEITLKDGDTQYLTCEMVGRMRDVGFMETNWIVETGETRLKRVYQEVKEIAGTKGLEASNGLFYPHSAIAHIQNIGIEEVEQ